MATELAPQDCCGIWMLNGISHSKTPQDVLTHIRPALMYGGSTREKPFVIFSGVTQRVHEDQYSGRTDDYGQALMDFILEHKLGKVTHSNNRENGGGRGGNILRVWIWEPDYTNLTAYYNSPRT